MFTTANQKTTKNKKSFLSQSTQNKKNIEKNKDVISIYIIHNQVFSSFYHHLLIS